MNAPIKQSLICPVSAHNEWDKLEEVIVGRAGLACLPEYEDAADYCCADVTDTAAFLKLMNAQPDGTYGPERIAAANKSLDAFAAFLESGGVTVRRPTPIAFNKACVTPDWTVKNGFNCCHPRDIFMVVGDKIIETPVSTRERYFESWSYKTIMMDYFNRGAHWIAAPRPALSDALYDYNDGQNPYGITELEPCFDAADFVRAGKDIIGHLSHVTNRSGVEWLRRTLGDQYNVHLVKSKNPHALHIDTTFMPLSPGRALVNPDFFDMTSVPEALRDWELLVAPPAIAHSPSVRGFVSKWVAVNVLSLDDKRVLVDVLQKPLIQALKDWGFEPVPFDLSAVYAFGGGLHCVTLDIRRTKQSA
jgi:glycine amidinotransferase